MFKFENDNIFLAQGTGHFSGGAASNSARGGDQDQESTSDCGRDHGQEVEPVEESDRDE